MIGQLPFRDRTVAVLGLARSGAAAAEALIRSGAEVRAWDDVPARRDALAEAGVPVVDLLQDDPAEWTALVISPGIPLTHTPHPVAVRARTAEVPIIGDIELLWRAETGAGFIGVTGTNGKSTTTALIGHILQQAGRSVAVGGNLGIPVLALPRLGADGRYVIEMSSFQLDLIDQTRFGIAVLLNITPDHLDRHGDMAGYIAAKRRIFRHQQAGDVAIVGVDDAETRAIADELAARAASLVRISAAGPVAGGVSSADGILVDDLDAAAVPVLDLRTVATLPGQHNWQNAAAAYAACRAAGLLPHEIAAGIAKYPGLPHRQELVGRIGRVRFVNDSKATNADAAAKALACYHDIHWIAGGLAKADGIDSLVQFQPRIAHAYLIGAAADAFARTLEGKVETTLSGDLATALGQAASGALASDAAEPVVLLSPACASYDQFRDFEARGDEFRAGVARLVGRVAA
jgi:UDP-N-acetylmuramoylalanine--D-glutamate ligase